MKKTIKLLLIFIVALILLTGCSQKKTHRRRSSKEDSSTIEVGGVLDMLSSGNDDTDSNKTVDLTPDDLKELVYNAQIADDWFIGGNSLVDWDDYIDINGEIYYKVISNDMNNTEDVYNFISNCYTSSIVDNFRESGYIIDFEGSIYGYTGGIGGMPSHTKMVKAVKDGDNYSVTFYIEDPYGFEDDCENNVTIIKENEKYVFSDRVHSLFTNYDNCEFIVE